MRRLRCLTLLILAALLLVGCETPGPTTRTNPLPVERAEQLYVKNRFVEAARAFSQSAETQRPDYHYLRAADSYWMARDSQSTRRMLGQVRQGQLAIAERALARLLSIASAAEPPPATTILSQLAFRADSIPENYRVLFHHLRAEAYSTRRQPYQSAVERVALDDYLSVGQQPDNHQKILAVLRSLPHSEIQRLYEPLDRDQPMFAWLALTIALQQARADGQPLGTAIAQWRSDFPTHPAANDPVDTLLGAPVLLGTRPSSIALLLPMSGRFAALGRAVRDGFLTAYYEDQERNASVRIYDVSDSPERAALQYDLAVRDGAQQIVGPLSKEAVTEMLLKADGRVPVLALNESQEGVPAAPGIFQFGLLPEQEAASVARRMIAEDKRRAVVLVPSNRWGDRIGAEFSRVFEQYGGQVLNSSRYPVGSNDFKQVITGALGLSASNNRVAALERVTGLQLRSEASARSDLDAIFLGARPNQGRLIKPQFDFHNAADVPVYSTSAIYAGKPDPGLDKDMNGVQFCDAPWLIGAPSQQPDVDMARQYFTRSGTPLRLFALGLDAYRLLPNLGWLMQAPDQSFAGASGELNIDSGGRVYRELGCAIFQRGLARYVEPPARLLDRPSG